MLESCMCNDEQQAYDFLAFDFDTLSSAHCCCSAHFVVERQKFGSENETRGSPQMESRNGDYQRTRLW